MSEKIRVLIVDDASFMVNALKDIIEDDSEVEVVGSAANGIEALEKIKELGPDVVTLDVDMPVMDGLSAIRHIMVHEPVPIVMLSSLFRHGDITFEALRLGVVDFLPKPSGAISRDIHEQGQEIIERIKIAAAVHINNVHRVKLKKIDVREQLSDRYGFNDLDYLVAMGTTLGGPNTVIRILSKLSPKLPAAIVVVQEIAISILPAFVSEFNQYTRWKIEVAIDGTILEPGSCYISSYHEPMIIQINEAHQAVLRPSPRTERPLDELFFSAAESFEQNAIGVMLTGVGSEGGDGFEHIKAMSGTTIAQNTETCVYPNLTECVIERDLVDWIAEVDELRELIEKTAGANSEKNHVVSL